jgi:hypothetical protein
MSRTRWSRLTITVWRRTLKDFIAYYREAASACEVREKQILKFASVLSNAVPPAGFLKDGGIMATTKLLHQHHRETYDEAEKAKNLYNEIVHQLTGLRGDLNLKIKEIKSLSGDFKNSVEKEMETTRKAVQNFQSSVESIDSNPAAATGRGDPYIVRLGVERQIRRQIEEENYLHTAYLNLEGSGRELESIIVGEIQKAFDIHTKILKRETEGLDNLVDSLQSEFINMPKDKEWNSFIASDASLVDPNLPLRKFEDIIYPGKSHPAAAEVRAGMLERKSKYLKSYTPGWYVLSPSHLHEFKSPDRIQEQTPVMSLYLPEQKLGSHSQPNSSSHKFMLKGRQTGNMHRGHSWVFRAESHDTMMEWFESIKALTEVGSGAERNELVLRHRRTISTASVSGRSVSSDMEEDEADLVPYSGNASTTGQDNSGQTRPAPGGAFGSQISIDRRQDGRPRSTTSGESEDGAAIAAGAMAGVPAPVEYSANYSGFATEKERSVSARSLQQVRLTYKR